MKLPKHLSIMVASADDYEQVFAELSWDDVEIVYIHQDLGRARPQLVYGNTYKPEPKIEVPVDWLLESIRITTDHLVGDLNRDTPIPLIIEPDADERERTRVEQTVRMFSIGPDQQRPLMIMIQSNSMRKA